MNNDRCIEIYYNVNSEEFEVNVRWCEDGEQHEEHVFKHIDEVNDFLKEFYVRRSYSNKV